MEAMRVELVKLKTMWSLCCFTPILYLLVAQIVASRVFASREVPGFIRLQDETYRALLFGAGGLAISLQGTILWVRRFYDTRMRSASRDAARLLHFYTRRTFVLVALSETMALIGFVLFLLNGQLSAAFCGGLIGMIFYAQSYPSETRLREITLGQ